MCLSVEKKVKAFNYLYRNPKKRCNETGTQVQIGKAFAVTIFKDSKRPRKLFNLSCERPLKKMRNLQVNVRTTETLC